MLGGFQTRSGQDEEEKYPYTRQKSNPCHPNRSLFYTDRDILAAVTKGSISTGPQFHDQAQATVKTTDGIRHRYLAPLHDQKARQYLLYQRTVICF